MMQVVKQREYIENFLKFVGSFMVTENVTVDELLLVEKNLDILKERIQEIKRLEIKGWLLKGCCQNCGEHFYSWEPEKVLCDKCAGV